MRKIKLNYEQAMEVLAMHLESLGAIRNDEKVEITPVKITNGMITVYVTKGT
jgi:hypothetical protein